MDWGKKMNGCFGFGFEKVGIKVWGLINKNFYGGWAQNQILWTFSLKPQKALNIFWNEVFDLPGTTLATLKSSPKLKFFDMFVIT